MTILQSNFSDTLSLLILVFRHLLLVAMVRFCYGAFMLVLSLSLTFNVLTLIRYQTPLLILAPYRDSNLILAPYHYSNLTPSPYSLLPAPMTLTLTFQVSVGCGLSIVEQNHMRPYLWAPPSHAPNHSPFYILHTWKTCYSVDLRFYIMKIYRFVHLYVINICIYSVLPWLPPW